ncbi:MAG: tetratricopeptide repeat protein [Verrucomicrobia bacterium]|nr:tetratricopeptide repeat protein [Verrucomicrobiota bacterium]
MKAHSRIMLSSVLVLGMLAGVGRVRADDAEARLAHWRAGAAAFEDGLYEVAERELQAYLKQAVGESAEVEEAVEAVGMLTRAMLAQQREKDALDFLGGHRWWMRRAAPGAIPFWRALTRYELTDIRGALVELKDFKTDFTGSAYAPRALRLSAWCELQLGNTNAALQAFADFDKAFHGTTECAQNRLEWGQALMAVDRMAEADAVLAELVEDDADQRVLTQAQFWRSRILLEQGQWTDASALLDEILKHDIADPDLKAECAFALGRARMALGDLAGASEVLKEGLFAAQSRDLRLTGSRRLGLLYLEQGKLEEGVGLLQQFVSGAPLDPRAEESQLAMADALLRGERLSEASDAYQFYLEAFTNQMGVAKAYRGRGWALKGLGRFAESAAAFEMAYVASTNTAEQSECLYKAGDAYFANQQYKLAADAYERLLALDSDSAQAAYALYQLAQCAAMDARPDMAEATYSNLAEQFPATGLAEEAMLRIAQLHESMGELPQAAECYSAIIQAFTNGSFTADALLGRGLARYRMEKYGEALEDFVALTTQYASAPQAEEARFRMIMCTYLLGRDAEALEAGRIFLERYPLSPFTPRVQYWMGKHAFNAGQYAEAEARFMQFYTGYPVDRDAENALLWAGRAAARAEEYLRANEILTTLLKDIPQGTRVAEARYEQGCVLAALAKFPEAILAFQEVVNRYPTSDLIPDTWLRIGDCQFMMGIESSPRYEQAIAAYRAASTHPNAKVDLILQAEYKIGRCMQKLQRPDEAIDQHYKNVMVRFLEERERGKPQTDAARIWFGRAARDTADILQERKEWRKVVSVLERAVEAGVPDETGIRERIRDIRTQQWWLFY